MAIGLFHTRLNVSNNLPGAPFLTLDLLVNTPAKKVTGVARIAQATHPVQVFHADVWGSYSELPPAAGAGNAIVLHLDGNPSGPLSQIAETFHLQGLLDADWSNGNASYRYLNGDRWIDQPHVRVRKAPDVTHQNVRQPAERLQEAIRHLQSA
ncbi:hypothetical protein CCOS865_03490 [Pseudomonas reidholzensis]|uniref:DUF1842 domain-containing protein n=1 Tax=Pseudomonas reidholzensis TaxID=1785162 RepID=A0A383RXQ3_9PSED|nr:DUF1842 domain-containing protein [Pseudomonas reidholzensis]SYX91221.1 hypothetical protein CCOS865_03490 [Pseudomonas reidholzensis]